MLSKLSAVCAAALFTVAVMAGTGHAKPELVPVVKLHTRMVVQAPPAEVWANLTTGKSLVTWCPYWKGESNAKVVLAKVGDVLDYSDAWGNNGRSIVTFIDKEKELRVAHEPNDGSYMCQSKIVLMPAAEGTQVDYWEMYTDTSDTKDRAATAQKMEAEMTNTLVDLRKVAEKK